MEESQPFKEVFEFYKYIDITPGSLKTISENALILSPPSKYYQPFDCNPGLMKLQFNKNEIQNFVNNLEGLSNYKKQKMLSNILKTPDKFENALKNEIMLEIMEKWGMNCFSEICDNIPMWNQYASRHEGMCLKFDARYDDQLKSYKVNYVDKINTFQAHANSNEMIKFLLLTKPLDLAFEKETRLIKTYKGPLKFDKAALTEIIFGLNTFETDIERVVKLTKEAGFPHITFKRSRISKENFWIYFEEF